MMFFVIQTIYLNTINYKFGQQMFAKKVFKKFNHIKIIYQKLSSIVGSYGLFQQCCNLGVIALSVSFTFRPDHLLIIPVNPCNFNQICFFIGGMSVDLSAWKLGLQKLFQSEGYTSKSILAILDVYDFTHFNSQQIKQISLLIQTNIFLLIYLALLFDIEQIDIELNSYKFYIRAPKQRMRRSSRSTQKKQEIPVVRKSLRDSVKNGPKRSKTQVKNDPEPSKKLKQSESKDLNKSLKDQKKPTNGLRKTATTQRASSVDKPIVNSPKKEPVKPAVKPETKQEVKKQVKLILKGGVPVDPYVSNKNTRVLVHDGKVYASTLNQANVSQNNNKFYILQVLQSQTNSNNYYFFTRWGRVGVVGQQAQAGPMPMASAIRQYNAKLSAKSSAGDYTVVEMNYQQEAKKEEKKTTTPNQEKKDQVQSTLDPKVQELIRLIFDMKMINSQMKQIGYDANKMPLGKLAKSSIMKGYEALKRLMEQVKGQKRRKIFEDQSSNFFSNIPHDFGFKNMATFILDSDQKIKAKLQMLQSLQDIQIFTKLLDEGKIASDMNELDSNYLKLNTEIRPLDHQSEEFKIIQKYVINTHATTHKNFKVDIEQVYTLSKDIQNDRYRKEIPNKQLLWHGSRLTNYVGILSQGLRIAPPEAPVTGYMFGKGVYFADMFSKSANYCFTNKQNNTGIMLLCEVALGQCNEKLNADYYANLLPDGKSSTKGCGKTAPKGGQKIGDIWVPNGPGDATGLAYSGLLYNEFIVYDVAQIKSKYLLKMKFIYP